MLDNGHLDNEQELFQRIADGDEKAYTAVFRTYLNPLYKNILKILKYESWAEEVVQQLFTRLWTSRELLADVESPSSYLYRMATNLSLDYLRKQNREVKMLFLLERQAAQQQSTDTSSPDWRKVQLLLDSAIETLPPQRRLIYRLKYNDELTYDEIAAKLSLSRNTVRNHISNAIEDIRNYLLEHADLASLILLSAFL